MIFIAGNSFQHLEAAEDIASCFETVKRHMAPDGRFIIEVFNPYVGLLMREAAGGSWSASTADMC